MSELAASIDYEVEPLNTQNQTFYEQFKTKRANKRRADTRAVKAWVRRQLPILIIKEGIVSEAIQSTRRKRIQRRRATAQ